MPDPERALDEIARVIRPWGEIVLVNHLGAEESLRRAFEQGFAPIVRPARLAPGISLGAARAMGRAGQPDVRLLERRPMPLLGHFSLIRFARMPRQAPPAGTRGAGDGKLA